MGVDAEMFLALPTHLTDREVIRLNYEIYAGFGTGMFTMGFPDLYDGKKEHALSVYAPPIGNDYCGVYQPDGSGVPADWQVLRVHLMGRYWGPGYERGPWPDYAALMHFFRVKYPDGKVLYGGDTGFVREMTKEVRDEYWEHFAMHQGRPYRLGSSLLRDDLETPFCDFCQEPMVRNGWGANYAAFYCYCGAHRTTQDGGQTWLTEKDKVKL